MALYLLDTNVLVAAVRQNALYGRIEQQYQLQGGPDRPFCCIVTHGEILSLARQFGWGSDKLTQLGHILTTVVSWIDISRPSLVEAYAEIDVYSASVKRTMGKNDIWIAAAAAVTSLPLLTTDRDFLHLDPTFLTCEYIDPGVV